MRKLQRYILALFALVASAAAAQDSLEGAYIVERMETASMLELQPGGRFRWAFTYGAVDLSAEGRWRREGDAVILDTDPPATPPRFEVIDTSSEGRSRLIVRIETGNRAILPYLDIEAEHEGGETSRADFDPDQEVYRFSSGPAARIVAVRAGIAMYNVWSERMALPDGANRLRLRFFLNDLARGDFRGTRAAIEGESLLLPVLGEPLRYRRLSAEEQAEYAGMIDDIEGEAGGTALPGDSGFVPVELEGPLELAIGGPVDPRLLASEHGGGLFASFGPVELSVRIGSALVNFGRVGAGDQVSMIVRAQNPERTVERLDFSHQERLLTLAETMERGRALQDRLVAAGFASHAPRPDHLEWPPFFMVGHARDGEEAFLEGRTGIFATDWDSAQRLLADPEIGAVTMHLFTFKAANVHVMALAEHAPRRAQRSQYQLDPPPSEGREWMLNVTIMMDPATASPLQDGDLLSEP